jgi:hypothetical protein
VELSVTRIDVATFHEIDRTRAGKKS